MKIDEFLIPVSDDKPCGDNLEYDASFLTLEEEAKGKSEQQFGDTIIQAVEPDWHRIEKLSLQLLSRTKDLRVAIYLMMAWTNLKGFNGYNQGLELITGLLELFWDEVHPGIEDDDGFLMRTNTISSLGDGFNLFKYIKRVKLISSNSESLDFREVCAVLDGSSKRQYHDFLSKESVQAALLEQCKHLKDVINLILQRLENINNILREKIGESAIPEMGQLINMLSLLKINLLREDSFLASHETKVTVGNDISSAQDKKDKIVSTKLESKEDVKKNLIQIIKYFETHEPSHPASLMIERILSIIDLDFISIISELMPDEKEKVKAIFGKTDL